jgi:hypothetical protein
VTVLRYTPMQHLNVNVVHAIDMAIQAFSNPLTLSHEARQEITRSAISEIIFAHNLLQSATEIGERIETEGKFTVMNFRDIERMLKPGTFTRQQLNFVRGAVNDPFLHAGEAQGAAEEFDIGADYRQHAILNLRKAQATLKFILAKLMSDGRY